MNKRWTLIILVLIILAVVAVYSALQIKKPGTKVASEELQLQKDKDGVTDVAIPHYPSSAIAKAKREDPISKEATKFGLRLRPQEHKQYKQIRDRLFTNDTLVSALKIARDKGVTVYLKKEFYIGMGWVDIDVNASDKEIIEFILGSKEKSEE